MDSLFLECFLLPLCNLILSKEEEEIVCRKLDRMDKTIAVDVRCENVKIKTIGGDLEKRKLISRSVCIQDIRFEDLCPLFAQLKALDGLWKIDQKKCCNCKIFDNDRSCGLVCAQHPSPKSRYNAFVCFDQNKRCISPDPNVQVGQTTQ